MSQIFSWITRVGCALTAAGLLVAAGTAYAVVPTLSQTSITVGYGQQVSVTSGNGVNVYMGSNSNPTIASVSVNGTQITVMGQALGSAAVTICAVGTASDCANLTVTVQAAGVAGISFSPSNPSLLIGGNQVVTVSGGNGTYTVSNNSNASVASTNLSGNTLTVSGLAVGSATITVCDTSQLCGTLPVTINSSTSGISFNQSSISLLVGGSQVVTVSGGSGTYNVFSNSNTNVVSASVSGNGIIINAVAAGGATIMVCDTSGACGTLSTIVTASTANQDVAFSIANPTLTVGQTLNVGLLGSASSFVVLSNTNANVVRAGVTSGVTLSLYGASAGTDLLVICATGGGCSPLSVVVTTGSASNATTTTAPITTTVQVTTPATQSGTVIANFTLLSEIQTLQAAVKQVLTQIESIQTQLAQLEAQVNAAVSGSGVGTNASNPSGTSYNFTELLTVGSGGDQVTALQQRLTALGFYSGPITGFYGALTKDAVVKYQTAHGIVATGYVGPSTRAALNAGN
jgi:ferredoxin